MTITTTYDQCYVILRDVSKAFDKVWHNDLKYKIINLNLPDIITKFLNNFIDSRKAKIKIDKFTGQPFHLTTMVPKGSVILPTLYTIYSYRQPLDALTYNMLMMLHRL